MRSALAAPHRAWFLLGLISLALASGYWALQLWGLGGALQHSLPPGWLHAWSMLWLLPAPFVFGFLLTTFPAWLEQPKPGRGLWLTPLIGWSLGVAWLVVGIDHRPSLVTGSILITAAWAWLWVVLWRIGWRSDRSVIHANAALLGLAFGGAAHAGIVVWLVSQDPRWFFLATRVAVWGFLLPVFAAVCHRMIPFFTRCVNKNQPLVRPAWTLITIVAAGFVHLYLEARHGYGWLFVPDGVIGAVSLWQVWRWWPRPAVANPLLWTLHIGHLWLVVAGILFAVQSVIAATSGAFELGRAPVHALTIGCFASLLVAMVTRVSQGHSGRPLVMPTTAVAAFAGIQATAILRVLGEVGAPAWNQAAILAWCLALLPWILRYSRVLSVPRVDGKPG